MREVWKYSLCDVLWGYFSLWCDQVVSQERGMEEEERKASLITDSSPKVHFLKLAKDSNRERVCIMFFTNRHTHAHPVFLFYHYYIWSSPRKREIRIFYLDFAGFTLLARLIIPHFAAIAEQQLSIYMMISLAQQRNTEIGCVGERKYIIFPLWLYQTIPK